jgi:hypothetical protein
MMRACVSCGAVLCLVLAVSCQGGGAAAAAAKRDPAELGKDIAEAYLKMIDEVGVAVAAATDPATLRPAVDAIKEKYVARFVALGRQRDQLAPNDREACDSTARTKMMQVNTDALDAINAAAAACKASDPDLAKGFDELQRLTRYASFEQLRTQLPAEAKRLGIQ